MHGERRTEVAVGEGLRDRSEVGADRRGAGGVVAIALQLDATSVRER